MLVHIWLQHNLRLVLFVINKYFQEFANGPKFQDLCQAGVKGLITAIDRFEPTRKLRLSTYSLFWIRHAIIRSLTVSNFTRVSFGLESVCILYILDLFLLFLLISISKNGILNDIYQVQLYVSERAEPRVFPPPFSFCVWDFYFSFLFVWCYVKARFLEAKLCIFHVLSVLRRGWI